MARTLKLDRYVSRFVDQHGRERFRFRRKGYSKYLPHPALPEYKTAYQAALNRNRFSIASKPPISRSIEDLIRKYYRSLAWQQLSESRQRNLRSVIEPFREDHANYQVHDFRFHHIEAIVMERAKPDVIDRRRRGGPHAAR